MNDEMFAAIIAIVALSIIELFSLGVISGLATMVARMAGIE